MISPIYQSETVNDPVYNEMVRLDYHPSKPQRTISGTRIPNDLYQEYVERAGVPAYESVKKLIANPDWNKLDKTPTLQIKQIKKIIEEHRDVARVWLRFQMGETRSKEDKSLLTELGYDVEQMIEEAAVRKKEKESPIQSGLIPREESSRFGI